MELRYLKEIYKYLQNNKEPRGSNLSENSPNYISPIGSLSSKILDIAKNEYDYDKGSEVVYGSNFGLYKLN